MECKNAKARLISSQILLAVFFAAAAGFGTPSTGSILHAQEPNPTSQKPGQAKPNEITEQDGIYIYRVQVVQRDLDAVNYLHRSGSTAIGFKGTSLLPAAKGEAKVQSEKGGITISAHFSGLPPANGFGPEYLTYVLWAISADGRPNNLGEVLPSRDKDNINVTTALQSFGMMITAEPYFSVTEPSDVVVMQNVIQGDKTTGELQKVNAHYSLLPRGTYAQTDGSKTIANPITQKEKSPLELYEANNAVRIAQNTGADQYAADIMREANQDLKNASSIDSNKKGDRKMEITFARQAVQRAEDARIVTLRKQAAERQLNAEIAKRDAQAAAQQSQLEAQKAALQAQQSQMEAAKADAAKAEADAERARAEAAAAEARATAAEATKKAEAANQSAQDANAVREKLRLQLNAVLATSESARGLIVNMSDVLFDTAQYTLKPDTKISLAKVAGILQAYPGLKLQVEGYTDSVGSDEYNQKLSENRAGAVRDFLTTQGVQQANISAAGYGKTNFVADNASAAGRAQNRRVQLVVSGDAIGIQESAPTGGASQ